MNPRQRYALEQPLARADLSPGTLASYTRDRRHVTGLMLRTILAVDR